MEGADESFKAYLKKSDLVASNVAQKTTDINFETLFSSD